MKNIVITDTTLRDGMHTVKHQFTPKDMAEIASALDDGGINIIEIGHGDGLGGSTIQYGFAAASDEEYIREIAKVIKKAKLGVLLLPGIGTKKDLEMAAGYGAKVARIATHVTEADISEQHIKLSKNLGLFTVGFLMMSHMAGLDELVKQASLMESYGADIVYVTDSAGALVPETVRQRVEALRENLSIPIGFHAHNNLGLAIGNTLAAIEEGATFVDGSIRGMGAGSGNSQTEVLVAVLKKYKYEIDADLFKLIEISEKIVAPKMKSPQFIDGAALAIGYAGVYSSFFYFAKEASERFKVDVIDLLIELGRLKIVGGQEDVILDVAYKMSSEKPVVKNKNNSIGGSSK